MGTDRTTAGTQRVSNRSILVLCLVFFCAMIGMAYAAVPLYSLFCKVTGYGGTTQRAERAPEGEAAGPPITVTFNADDMIWNQLMTAPDGFRKRMALVFSEIFVVSRNDIGSSWPDLMMAQYWDMLVAGVTTNFRKLLEDVTLNPAMGYYLNTRGNQKENAQGRQPDENYAREVMQLMTIGLYQLNLRVPGFHISGDSLPVMLRMGSISSPTSGPAIPLVNVE